MVDSDIRELRNDIKGHGERLARSEAILDGIHRDITDFRGEISATRETLVKQSNVIASIQAKWALIGSLALALIGAVIKILT